MVVAHKSSNEELGILRRLFKKYDSRHDGSIWFEDFCKIMDGRGHSEEALRLMFDAMVSRDRFHICLENIFGFEYLLVLLWVYCF